MEFLEAHELRSRELALSNWDWVLDTDIPWLAIAILITELSLASSSEEHERAQAQIDRVFMLHGSARVSETPMWKILVQLRRRVQGGPPSTENVEPRIPATAMFADEFMLDLGDDAFKEQFMTWGIEETPW